MIHSLVFILISVFAVAVHAQEISDYKWSWGLQNRVMFSNSNIGNETQYDFFSQRLRINIGVESSEKVGAFSQIEYRGTFGAVNGYSVGTAPFNRLNARGLRYGYIYAPFLNGQIQVGLVPLNDQIHQTLFSADWDFNVGGLTHIFNEGDWSSRVSMLRYLEAKDIVTRAPNSGVSDSDQNLYLLDLNYQATESLKVGVHYYGLTGKLCNNTATCGVTPSTATNTDFADQNQNWLAATFNWQSEILPLEFIIVGNSGKLGAVSNSGQLVLLEGKKDVSSFKISGLAIASSGKTADASNLARGTGYETIMDLKGTAGYWGYAHIFAPSGPSDINGYLISPSNKGFGLQTFQIQVSSDFTEKWSGLLFGAQFSSEKEMTNAAGAAFGRDLGTEFGAVAKYKFNKQLNWEFGIAQASLGDAGKTFYQQTTDSRVSNLFWRLQLEL